jgi:polysaccharide chain length determinant protein (PEP-CTERM system associated)
MLSHLPESVRYYLAGIWTRRWSALGLAVAFCLAGWLVVVALPSKYTSEARIYVDTDTLLKPLMKGLSVDQDTREQVEIVRSTLLSRPNIQKLARMTDMDLQADNEAEFERLVTRLQQNITVKAERTTLFRVSYTHADAGQAQRVVDGMIDIFIEENLGRTQQDVDSAQRFLDKQIAKYEAKLREADNRITSFKRAHSEALTAPKRAQQRLDQLDSELRNLDTERDTLVWKREQIRLRLSETPRRVPADQADRVAAAPSPREQRLAELQGQLSNLLTRYTEKHPDVQYVRRQIEALKNEPAAREGTGEATGESSQRRMVANPAYDKLEEEAKNASLQIEALDSRIAKLETEMTQIRERLAEAPEAEAQLAELQRDYSVLENNYQELLQRRERARIAASVDAENTGVDFRIVEPANKPVVPSGPPRGIFMSAVLLLGMGAGVGASALRLQLSETFIDTGQLRSAFGLPVLGAVTQLEGRNRIRRVLGHVAFAALIALLVSACVIGFYVFQIRSEPIDSGAIVESVMDRLRLWWSLRG